jgi:hypothetical protein
MSRFIHCYAECHYAECLYAECRGAHSLTCKFDIAWTYFQLPNTLAYSAEMAKFFIALTSSLPIRQSLAPFSPL